MFWTSLLAGVLGFLLVYLPGFKAPAQYEPSLSVAVMAGLDAVVGGTRAIQEGTFKTSVFLSGFVLTVLIAVLLTYFGDAINAPVWQATVFVFTFRILNNVSFMRRYWLEHERLRMPGLMKVKLPKELFKHVAPSPPLTQSVDVKPEDAPSAEPVREDAAKS
jgi:small basic protein